MTPVAELSGAGFRYRRSETPALRDIDLVLEPGEVLLVAGPSGCGKSTLIRLLNGLAPHAYSGDLYGRALIGGLDTRTARLRELAPVVGTLLQDPSRQIVGASVEAEIAFGPENLGLPRAEIAERIERTLALTGLEHLRDRPTSELSGGERQLVALAGVLVMEPALYVIDEPLANLDPATASRLLDVLRAEADRGRAIVIVEHRVEEALDLRPDRVLGLEAGAPTYLGDVPGFLERADPRQVKVPFVVERFARVAWPEQPAPIVPGAALAALVGVSAGYGQRRVLHDVSTVLARGETLAVLGPNGAGKTTVFRTLIGLTPPSAGRVEIDGRDAASRSVADRARDLGFVFQSPRQMLFAPTVSEELAFAPRLQGLSEPAVEERVADALRRVRLDRIDGIRERPPLALSFGQQKRLAVAVALSLGPRALILDEPTAGQDLGTAEAFIAEARALEGVEHLALITHDVDIAVVHADRLVLVRDGAIVADGPPTVVIADRARWLACNLRDTTLVAAARTAALPPGRVLPPALLARRLQGT